jgi:hypothetical protein
MVASAFHRKSVLYGGFELARQAFDRSLCGGTRPGQIEFCFHRKLQTLQAAGGGQALKKLYPSLPGRKKTSVELVLPYFGPEVGWPKPFEPKRMISLGIVHKLLEVSTAHFEKPAAQLATEPEAEEAASPSASR